MSEHTPGPWETYRGGHAYTYPDSPQAEIHILADERDVEIASCVRRDIPKDQHAANARLIAAAPELLEALVALLDSDVYADGEGLVSVSGGSTSENEEAVKAARAAIAKATAHQQANRRE